MRFLKLQWRSALQRERKSKRLKKAKENTLSNREEVQYGKIIYRCTAIKYSQSYSKRVRDRESEKKKREKATELKSVVERTLFRQSIRRAI